MLELLPRSRWFPWSLCVVLDWCRSITIDGNLIGYCKIIYLFLSVIWVPCYVFLWVCAPKTIWTCLWCIHSWMRELRMIYVVVLYSFVDGYCKRYMVVFIFIHGGRGGQMVYICVCIHSWWQESVNSEEEGKWYTFVFVFIRGEKRVWIVYVLFVSSPRGGVNRWWLI